MKSVDRAISRIIAPRMRALAFSRRHNTWNRRLAGRVQVVHVQQSSSNTDMRASFTANLGHRLDLGLGEGMWVRPTDCRPEPRRLGFLTPAREDTWYRCVPGQPADVDRAVRACLADLETYGLPWLDGSPAPDAATRDPTDDGSPRAPRWLRWLGRHTIARW